MRNETDHLNKEGLNEWMEKLANTEGYLFSDDAETGFMRAVMNNRFDMMLANDFRDNYGDYEQW